jgi:hypothetical protein
VRSSRRFLNPLGSFTLEEILLGVGVVGAAGVAAWALWPKTAAASPPPGSPSSPSPPSGGSVSVGPVVLGGNSYDIQLVPNQTVIQRMAVGDSLTVTAPSGWGVPAAMSNIPGFLTTMSSDATAGSSTFNANAAGQGQISMTSGGETAILSVEVS